MPILAVLVILIVEICVFNLPFWSTLSASTDTSSATNTLGSGLSRTSSGALKVTDPTTAWLEVTADGSSPYARIDPSGTSSRSTSADKDDGDLVSTVHVRLDSDGAAGRARSIDITVPRSRYLKTTATHTIKLWIQEPKGTVVPISAIRANVHVPFQVSPARLAIIAVIMLLVAVWRPGSRWWSIEVDPRSRLQRGGLIGACLLLVAVCLAAVVRQLLFPGLLSFHAPGGYVYDFNQYGHVAESLAKGRAWLDLPVPDELVSASNPYDPQVRERLLNEGVTPIYWDYAFHNGHWYSYFGVIPAVVLFLPYHLISRLWIDGGGSLASSAAVPILLTVFLILDIRLVLLLLRRIRPHASVAAATISITVSVIGSGTAYLWYQNDFYSVPLAFSLVLSTAGLLLWFTAATDSGSMGRLTARWGDAPAVSLPRVAAGSLLMAANLGSRPSFVLFALLAIPIFHRQLSCIASHDPERAARPLPRRLLTLAAVSALPALLVAIPLGWYNLVRFGSPIDFGVNYQLTVVDMTSYSTPLANILPMLGYYLFLPFHTIDTFPWLATSPTPLPYWGYTEPLTMGLFVAAPAIMLCLAAPAMRRRWRTNGMWPFLVACTLLGLAMVLLDILKGGLGWRYMSDFGWILSLPAVCALTGLLSDAGTRMDAGTSMGMGISGEAGKGLTTMRQARLRGMEVVLLRGAVLLLVLWTIGAALWSMLVIGRDNSLIRSAPAVFHTLQSWFLPWL